MHDLIDIKRLEWHICKHYKCQKWKIVNWKIVCCLSQKLPNININQLLFIYAKLCKLEMVKIPIYIFVSVLMIVNHSHCAVHLNSVHTSVCVKRPKAHRPLLAVMCNYKCCDISIIKHAMFIFYLWLIILAF